MISAESLLSYFLSLLYIILVWFDLFLGLIQKPPRAKMNPSSSYFTVCCWPSFRYFALNAKATSQVLLWNSMELWLSCTNIAFIAEKMLLYGGPNPSFLKYPAGNMLLSFTILMAGASVSKIFLVFKHMNRLCMYDIRTYFIHQDKLLFPVVLSYWESYRSTLLNQVKDMKDVVWSGDGRYDSMGHSAKFGVYTVFCCTLMKIVHFELLQVSFG